MFRNIVFVVLIFLAGTALDARADKWIDPMPRLFASQSGQFGLKSLEPKLLGPSNGVLFAIQNDGTEKVIWRATFPNAPHQVFIANDGRFVVTVDTWGVLGSDHSLVIYDGRGTQVRSLKLEDLLTANEIKAKVKQTVSSRWWAENATFQFVENDRLLIRLSWGKQLRVQLAAGRME